MDTWETFLPTTSDSMPSLAVLDDRCRCSVCKDYLQGPMMTLCGHTFCSLCIRRALNAEGRCPTCRALEEEGKLRKNLMIEEIVEAFMPFRASLMQFAQTIKLPDESPDEVIDVTDDNTDEAFEEQSIDFPSHPVSTTLASPPAKRTGQRTTRASTRAQAQPTESLPAGHIRCPVCQLPIHQDKAEYHVNRCLEGKATPPPQIVDRSSEPVSETDQQRSHYFTENSKSRKDQHDMLTMTNSAHHSMKRLPKISYGTMNDAKLRKVMIDMGINSSGSRTQLQKRCTEFIAMWNANLDSKNPKPKRELLNEMRLWDRVQAKPIVKYSHDEIDKAHQNGKYDQEFTDLIAQARSSLRKRKHVDTSEADEASISKDSEHESKKPNIE